MKYYPNNRLDEITKRIVELMPALDDFFSGNESISGYSSETFEYVPSGVHRERQGIFFDLIDEKISRLFTASEQLDIRLPDRSLGLKGGVVDHHGILNHPVLLGVNVTPHYSRMFDRKENGDILTFATGNVPLNDPLHRRGFMIGGQRVNIFPKSDKNKIVYGLPKYTFDFVESQKKSGMWSERTDREKSTLNEMQALIDALDFDSCYSLGDQITKINFHLWPLLFAEGIRDNVSNLISLEYDDIVISYFKRVISDREDSFIHSLVFDKDYRERARDFFDGKTGAWNTGKGTGTFLFWALDKENKHVSLRLEDDCLVSDDKSTMITLDEASVFRALDEKLILPGMLLKFSLILFYLGMKPFAGYGSANYLSVMQKEVADFMRDDFLEEVSNFESLAMNNVTSVPVLLKRDGDGNVRDYFAFDIISDGGLGTDYFSKIDSVPLKYFMASNLNTMYDYAYNLYGSGEKELDFRLTPEDYGDLFVSI